MPRPELAENSAQARESTSSSCQRRQRWATGTPTVGARASRRTTPANTGRKGHPAGVFSPLSLF